MLGLPIAARPLARDGLGRLGSDFGRTRLAEAALPAWDRASAVMTEQEAGVWAAPDAAAAATRP